MIFASASASSSSSSSPTRSRPSRTRRWRSSRSDLPRPMRSRTRSRKSAATRSSASKRRSARSIGASRAERLEEALRKIDRNVKRGRALGAPILVTVNAKGKPIADLFEEMKTSTGQPIACHDLPPDKITIAFEKLGFWEALDRVCKTHGGVMWAVKEKEIVVSKRAYRDLPKVFRGNQIVYFERLSSDHQLRGPASPPTLSLEGGFAWTDRKSVV